MKTVVIIAGLGVWAACAFAQDEAKPQEISGPAGQASAPAPVKASGSMVFVDPITRKIRKPGPSEIGARGSQSQAAVAARPRTAPVVIHSPGGAVGILRDDSQKSFMVATRKADGKIAIECVTGPAAANRAANSPEPSQAVPETK
jgi:hypothetical protein